MLTRWGWVTHICIGKLTIIGSDNGLSPGWRQAIIWTNAGILLFGPLGSYFCEILIEIDIFSFKKMHLKLSSAKWRPSCLGLNVLIGQQVISWTYKNWVHCCHVASISYDESTIQVNLLVESGNTFRWYPAKRALPDRALLAGYPRYMTSMVGFKNCPEQRKIAEIPICQYWTTNLVPPVIPQVSALGKTKSLNLKHVYVYFMLL